MRGSAIRGHGAASLFFILASCGGFPRPYTAAELRVDSRERAGEALVHYLGQTGADVGVCAAESHVLERFTHHDVETFIHGLEDNQVAPQTWTACAQRILGRLHGGALADGVAQLADRFAENLGAGDGDTRRLYVLSTLGGVLDARPNGAGIPDPTVARIGLALAGHDLGARARRIAATTYEGLEMERGRLHGQPVTRESLGALDDVAMLRRLMQRLPTADGRGAARERVVDLGLARSTSTWVRAHTSDARAHVLATGRDAIDLGAQPVASARYVGASPGGTVLVEQHVDAQTARLLFRLPTETSVVPSLDLRGGLLFAVADVDAPITLCGPAESLDVAPCVDSKALTVASSVAQLDADGVLHFRDGLALPDLASLLAQGRSSRCRSASAPRRSSRCAGRCVSCRRRASTSIVASRST